LRCAFASCLPCHIFFSLENELLRSQITSINNPNKAGSAYSNDQSVIDDYVTQEPLSKIGSKTEKDHKLDLNKKGIRAGVEQMFTPIRDNTGKITYTWNDKAGENEVMQAISALAVTLPNTAINNIYSGLEKLYGITLDARAKWKLKKAVRKHQLRKGN
jgi:hypothetical protein